MALTAQVRQVGEPEPRDRRRAAPVPRWRRVIAVLLKMLIPLAILAAAAQISWTLYFSAPVAERQARPRVPRLVEVVEVHPVTQGPMIEAWGEVTASRTLSLRPEVGGTVVELSDNLTPGSLVSRGDVLIRLDDRELTHAVARADAEMRQIEARISIEEGQHERARRDLERLPAGLTDSQRNLVLRIPQMEALQAELAAAEAAREQALVALSHTVIRAPFDAVVISEQVAAGAALSPGVEAAVLVATDRFDVLLAVPVAALDWINPQAGQILRLTQPGVWPEGSFREGRVERLTAGLRATGRMAELVVTIEDPLARLPENRGKPRLLLGSFLRAVGEGRKVADAVALDRAYLRDNDTVWVMAPDGMLEIRPVEVGWRGAEQVLISGGLAPGDRVVTTPLAVVAPGMELRVGAGGGG
jgi:RND family efflux transporter MFP subunit